jgi:hypothetical protein
LKQNLDETHSKQPKIHRNPYQPMDFKNLKKKFRDPKVSRLMKYKCFLAGYQKPAKLVNNHLWFQDVHLNTFV